MKNSQVAIDTDNFVVDSDTVGADTAAGCPDTYHCHPKNLFY